MSCKDTLPNSLVNILVTLCTCLDSEVKCFSYSRTLLLQWYDFDGQFLKLHLSAKLSRLSGSVFSVTLSLSLQDSCQAHCASACMSEAVCYKGSYKLQAVSCHEG